MQGFEVSQGSIHESSQTTLNVSAKDRVRDSEGTTLGVDILLRSPIAGVLVPLHQVPDPVFSQNSVGVGVAIDPTDEVLVAPCEGTVLQVHSSGHALFIRTRANLEILIHIGLETVKLKGEGFTPLVKTGARVTEGQPLIRFDADLIARRAKSLLTIVVLSPSDRIESLQILPNSTGSSALKSQDPLMLARLSGEGQAHSHLDAKDSPSIRSGDELMSDWIGVHNPAGIHARPAAMLVNLSKKFGSEIFLVKGSQRASTRSLVALMSLEVGSGDQVRVTAKGSDAAAAVAALANSIRDGLGEGHPAEGRVGETPGVVAAPAHPVTAKVVTPPAVGEKALLGSSGRVLQGVMASPGRAVGQIFQMRSQEILVREVGESEVKETERLLRALCEAKLQLETVAKLVHTEGDSSRALIFEAHQELLEDPTLMDLVRRHLGRGKSAAFAWKLSYTETAEQLASLNNPLLAARATDIRDVGQRVLRLLEEVQSAPAQLPENSILVAEDLTPSDVASLDRDRVLGFVTTTGGSTSHVAILARSVDLPAVAGAENAVLQIPSGTWVILDATRGELRLDPTQEDLAECEEKMRAHQVRKEAELAKTHDAAVTTDGRRVEVVANIKGPKESTHALEMGAEGVGLLRTEFLFMNRDSAPTEEEQLAAYWPIAETFGKHAPVIIRTLDVGGDKPLRYLPLPHEENPFLGERGLRVSLNRPELFRMQLRAILRAAEAGDVRIMFPMVSTLDELRRAKAMLEEERVLLNARKIQVGIMVEVPSVAILADQFARECDFFSIGSNDLTQYTLAMDRGHPKLASQMDGLDPSVLRLIEISVKAAHSHGKWVGVCGGIASDPQAVPFLVGLGVDELSVSIPVVPSIKDQIRRLSKTECEALAARALQAESAAEIRSWVKLEET